MRALQFLEGMANSRVEANTITYNAGIGTFAFIGLRVHCILSEPVSRKLRVNILTASMVRFWHSVSKSALLTECSVFPH